MNDQSNISHDIHGADINSADIQGVVIHSADIRSTGNYDDIDTPYGRVRVNPGELMLRELLVTDEGAELEVVGLDPVRFEPAPEEEEDWGE